MADRELTSRQKKFIEVYAGNGTEAARLAGYTGSADTLGKTAHDLLRNPKILEAIEAREKKQTKRLIATREERQEFWTSIMLSEGLELKDRLRASELLGKSEADFIERVEHSVDESLAEMIRKARERKKPLGES